MEEQDKPLHNQLPLSIGIEDQFYEHLKVPTHTCDCGCGAVEHAAEMFWDDETDLGFISIAHWMQYRSNREAQ